MKATATALRAAGGAAFLVRVIAFLLFFAISRIGEMIPQLGRIPVVKLGILIALATLVAVASRGNGIARIGSSRIAGRVMVIGALAVLSVLYSVYRSASLEFLIGPFVAAVVLGWLVFATSSLPRALPAYFSAVALSGAVLSIVVLVQGSLNVEGRLELADSSYDPNDLAFIIVGTFPLLLARIAGNGGIRRLFWIAAAVASMAALLLTGSRGGFLALVVFGAWAFLNMQSGKFTFPKKLLVLGVLGAVALAGASLLPENVISRYASLGSISSDYNVVEEGRVAIWKRGLTVLASKPWGAGIGAFQYAEGSISNKYKAAHNMFLQATVELGVIGGLLYLTLFYMAWKVLRLAEERAGSGRPPPGPLTASESRMLRGGLLAVMAAGLFLSMAYSVLVFVMLFMAGALQASHPPPPKRAPRSTASA